MNDRDMSVCCWCFGPADDYFHFQHPGATMTFWFCYDHKDDVDKWAAKGVQKLDGRRQAYERGVK